MIEPEELIPLPHSRTQVHRMFELIEPIAAVSFGNAVLATFKEHGLRNIWDGYFAGRAAALGELAGSDAVKALAAGVVSYPLHRWREALDHAAGAGGLGTVKVAFDPRSRT